MVESLYYIAEIISRFDLIAIQEVRDNLKDINSVCKILGNDWGIFTSLVTQGRSGNKERLCFLYDKRTVSFRNIAGQVILPQSDAGDKQFARAPYLIRFQAGWLKFDICTAHIYYGKAAKTSPEYKRRITEIKDLVKYMKTSYVDKEAISNVFLVGDFNIENVESDAYKAATSSIFKIPEKILKSNLRELMLRVIRFMTRFYTTTGLMILHLKMREHLISTKLFSIPTKRMKPELKNMTATQPATSLTTSKPTR